jgi:tRNA pseudouridine32 synthase/23S rRNA pseudouridine746 synthase/23S rRNA pseudouridine1911/1915/1917 synthase
MMRKRTGKKRLPFGMKIIYEDDDILVVDKPSGLLTMGTGKDKTRTAYFILTDYVRKGYAKSRKRIFIVHRLDREASGILAFAKNIKAKLHLQKKWDKTKKKYLAVVHGRLKKKQGTISTYLAENKAHVVYSTPDTSKGKLSHTAYKILKETKSSSLLEVDLLTGRKHQIRVHLAEIGHPIVGDIKYGKRNERNIRLALHAQSLSFEHPSSGKLLTFETAFPNSFDRFYKDKK